MRYLGIDYGIKRTGIALSDEGGTVAFPRDVLEEDTLERIVKMVKEEGIEGIVLGESKDLAGSPNPVMQKIELFKKKLEARVSVPIVYEPEFMTSAQASRDPNGEARATASPHPRPQAGPVDASAAALILQSYLDKLNVDSE